MTIRVQPIAWQDGVLNIQSLADIKGGGDMVVQAGMATFPKGVRHPQSGLTAHAGTEVSLIISGSFEVETASGVLRVDGDSLVIIPPGEGHATTALADSRVFYILFGPQSE